jgi:toxin ParE1/3/4
MAQVIWAEPALNDLDAVADYIALDNPTAASELVQRIFRHVDQLIIHPDSGSKPRELRGGRYRQIVEPPCRIFYRREGETVYVLYVMRGERKLRPRALAVRSKKASQEGSGKPLSPRSVAKILILGGSVWRYGRRIKMVDGSPFADVRKPRAAKREPYILDAAEIAKLRAALDVPFERLLIELTLTTGMRSGEVRGLTWDSIDLEGKRLFIERQANRRGEEAVTKTEWSVRPIPVPAYLIPERKRWKLACPLTSRGLVFPGEPNGQGERNPIDADILLRHILRRAGLPPLRFHDLRHMAGTLMHEAGVPLKRAQEILGHASERTTLAIYTHSMRRTHDDSADKIAALAGLSAPSSDLGNKRETNDSVESQEASVSDCLNGSPGRNLNQRQNIENFRAL